MYTERQIECSLLMSSEISLSKLSEDFGERSDPSVAKTQKAALTIGEAVAITLKQALRERRLTMGVLDCGKLLSCSPNRVMVCILPEVTSGDISVLIQHTLIRSFCWEHEIRLLTVKDEESLLELVRGSPEYQDATAQSVSCMLLEYPTDGNSEADNFVCGYHDTVMYSDMYPKPVIHLPD
ncbi:growth arrest and DNA-damage-inducible protein gadd45 alpha [Plakobranchus ocellatus]|uniref:Growth arrest and DNA-damage-inducible protein gadd45 alpha n=1 Tax=Plakobranchus ocellatus TaxID=259542 RepID=A0AAV4AAM2_9GAST|nr:growth arrest and DNA-damage-inducible protein gadd45 alpha [Plakobranchus ocellatus]